MPRIETLRLKVGDAENGFLWTASSNGLYEAIFEDDGETGYFYGLVGSKESGDSAIVDALHIYKVADVVDPHAEYPIEIRWAEVGSRVGLFVEDKCHAVFDFDKKRAVCRTGFPPSSGGFSTSHDWDEQLAKDL